MATIRERMNSKNEISYQAIVRIKGYATERATFKRLTDARNWAQATEAAMRERRHFKSSEAKKHTVAEMIDRYMKGLEQQNPKRRKDTQHIMDWWKAELGHCILADLTKPLILEKIEKLAATKITLQDGTEKPISPSTVNRRTVAFGTVCGVAYNQWHWLDHHPMLKIKKLKEPNGRTRFLDEGECKRLLKACKNSDCLALYPMVVVALSTGARAAEIRYLQWKNVDFNRKAIVLYKTKNKETRVVPLTSHALEIVQELKRERDQNKVVRLDYDWVFPSPNNPEMPQNIRAAWLKAIKESAIKNFRYHDLRHTAASYLAMNKASLAEIAEVLGHKTLSMVKRYSHLSEAHTHSVVASMNEKIFGS